MTDIREQIDEAILEAFKPVVDAAIQAAKDYADREVDEAIADAEPEPEGLTSDAFNDLDEAIRSFDAGDMHTAKMLFSRAFRDIPGAPQWVD